MPEKPAQQIFFCPVGLVGAGKTTIIKPISERLHLLRLSTDELRKLLKESGHTYEHLKELYYKIVREYTNQGYSIAFDFDCGSKEAKDAISSEAERLGAKVIWVHINTPQDFIFEKFRNHPPSWLADNPQVMIDNYLSQKAKREKENLTFDFIYTFDTSRPDVKEQIEECLHLI